MGVEEFLNGEAAKDRNLGKNVVYESDVSNDSRSNISNLLVGGRLPAGHNIRIQVHRATTTGGGSALSITLQHHSRTVSGRNLAFGCETL